MPLERWHLSTLQGPSKSRGLVICRCSLRHRTTRARGATQKGISGVEVAAVLAVTIVVAALGVSIFRTHSIRGQIVDSLAVAEGFERRVSQYFEEHGEPPADAVM